ncbi:MAG TPA: hypothetical protein VKE96_03710 [Vicinamibacterales bacterium]|nr:hypothetical protein [Vicinamibacterales bacterium]
MATLYRGFYRRSLRARYSRFLPQILPALLPHFMTALRHTGSVSGVTSVNRVSSMLRAFVIQFDADVDIRERRIAGRAEHVWTGEVAHFISLEELMRFVKERIEADRNVQGSPNAEECQQ